MELYLYIQKYKFGGTVKFWVYIEKLSTEIDPLNFIINL